MKFYQEINLLPELVADKEEDKKTGIYFLWQKIFQQIHFALVNIKNADEKVSVGISFPEYVNSTEASEKKLGSKLRFFAETKEELEKLDIEKYLARFSDYVHIIKPRPILQNKIRGYAVFSRWSVDLNPERLARRYAKRNGISFEEALDRYKNFKEKDKPPYIQLKSFSGKRDFRLYISKKVVEQPQSGLFTCYGLSLSDSYATVPLF